MNAAAGSQMESVALTEKLQYGGLILVVKCASVFFQPVRNLLEGGQVCDDMICNKIS